ncbi:hypothetical protein [Streptomyces sp. NPDC102282]|uniref:hypothetical protein n=1 Tax=Streptomyces sp. NPDC102282 TaxID=3366154 RepID=UPI00381CD8DC
MRVQRPHVTSSASDATRQRVLDVAERLGYTPPAVRTGRRGRTEIIGNPAPDLISGYSGENSELSLEAADDERELFHNASLDAIRERERVAFFAKGLSTGLVLIAPDAARALKRSLEHCIGRAAGASWGCGRARSLGMPPRSLLAVPSAHSRLS